jgi:hypothetical protein
MVTFPRLCFQQVDQPLAAGVTALRNAAQKRCRQGLAGRQPASGPFFHAGYICHCVADTHSYSRPAAALGLHAGCIVQQARQPGDGVEAARQPRTCTSGRQSLCPTTAGCPRAHCPTPRWAPAACRMIYMNPKSATSSAPWHIHLCSDCRTCLCLTLHWHSTARLC